MPFPTGRVHCALTSVCLSVTYIELPLLKVYSGQKKWISQNYIRRVMYVYTSYFILDS